ncbi:MAG TPA: hypothetical protein VHH33_06770 [Nitrososphaeraceae archaeon]|nr:hypothetical protein [Nitrososphaeraceae archaeon]
MTDRKTDRKLSTIDYTKTVHLIVHGQHDLIDTIKHKLTSLGFTENNLVPASLQKTGNIGDYVAMVWPPMHSNQIIINEITGINQAQTKDNVMGAWSNINQKEISRIPLS